MKKTDKINVAFDKGPVKVEKPDYPLPKWDRKKPDEFG